MIRVLAILVGLIIISVLLVRISIKMEDPIITQEEIDVSLGIEDPFNK